MALGQHMMKLAAFLCGTLLALCMGAASAFAADSYEEDHILISLQPGVSSQDAYQAFAGLTWVDGQKLPVTMADESMGRVKEIPLAPGVSVQAAVSAAEELPCVEFAQPDYLLMLPEPVEPSDSPSLLALTEELLGVPLFVNDPFLPGEHQSYWHLENIGAFAAWQRLPQGNPVTVAVFDTGCNLNHSDLVDNLVLDYVYDAYAQKAGTEDFRDATGHGTHVTGTIAAVANNGLGTAGVGYNQVKVLPVNIFNPATGGGNIKALIRAYEYVIDLAKNHPELNIRVINMSLGARSSKTAPDEMVHQSMRDALDLGILSVCAAGNDARSDELWPSDFEEAFSVTSLNRNGVTPLDTSDFNAAKDLCAPGDEIWSTTCNGSYGYKSGTSMASPQVAAAAALLWSVRPDLTVDQVRQVLQATAAPLQVPEGREGLYGAGRLDVDAALAFLENNGAVFVAPFAPGVYQLTYMPLNASYSGVPTYWDYPFSWDATQGTWLCLTSQDPGDISFGDLVFDESLQAMTVSRPGAETSEAPAGDANGNGRMNIVDAQVAYERACGFAVFDPRDGLQWLTADVNADGALDSSDALAIQYAIHFGWLTA